MKKRSKRPTGSGSKQSGSKKTGLPNSKQFDRLYLVAVIALALGASYAHYRHISQLFENDRFFSHLSSLERQMSFRTEMGLYYSYYKTLIDAPSIPAGLNSILHDNVTEFPSTINVLKRFNLYPELALGVGFRLYTGFLNSMQWSGKSCFKITRGHNQPPVESCEGMADEAYFYVTPIFALNGLYVGVLFLMCWYLGGGIFGGLFTVLCFFFNHGEATRVMWTPPLRESFSVPFLSIQILTVTYVIKSRTLTLRHMLLLTTATVLFMLPWQFAQFVLLTQTLALFGCYTLRFIPASKMKFFLIGFSLSLAINIVMQFANAMLVTSFYFACLLSAWVVVMAQPLLEKLRYFVVIAPVQVISLLSLTLLSKNMIARVANVEDDAHIGNLLKAKFSAGRDFHTSLYLCSKEFDFIEPESMELLVKSLVLPCGLLVMLVIVYKVAWSVMGEILGKNTTEESKRDDDREHDNDGTSLSTEDCTKPHAELLYHLLQNLAFLVMAVLIMRLKLFWTPHLCVLAGLLASQTLFNLVQRHVRVLLVAVIAGCMAFQGYSNLRKQWDTIGEFNDPQQEQLVEWIQAKTPATAVFAGAMPIMAGVKLNAYRPIVNHPHYEDVDVRRRTLKVYQIYSRKPPKTVAKTLRGMGVDYVIVENGWCVRNSGPGCTMGEMWDVEDPVHRDDPQFCATVASSVVPKPFKQAFKNDNYQVLKVS
eukprot:scpid38878/ scgid14073/ Protein dpy-19 homolog 1; Dpy-19-like protein 1